MPFAERFAHVLNPRRSLAARVLGDAVNEKLTPGPTGGLRGVGTTYSLTLSHVKAYLGGRGAAGPRDVEKEGHVRMSDRIHGKARRLVARVRVPSDAVLEDKHLEGTAPGTRVDVTRATIARLQRTAGNQAVLTLMRASDEEAVTSARQAAEAEPEPATDGPHKVIEDTPGIMRMVDESAAPTGRHVQRAPIQRGRKKGGTPPGPEWNAAAAPAVRWLLTENAPLRNAGVNSVTRLKGYAVAGSATYDSAAKVWRYQAEQFDSFGEMQFAYLPESGYPAPTPTDDSGALSNEKQDNWQRIATILHNTRAGAVSRNWRAYLSVRLHEDYHWNTEWKGSLRPEIDKAMVEVRRLSVSGTKAKGEQVSAADAKAQLEPLAAAIFEDHYDKASEAYGALGDAPGDPPYLAQAPAHDALERRVREYATAKKWV